MVDLATALDQLVQEFVREHAIALHMDRRGTTQQLSRAKQMALVKLAQEALHNVARHSQAHAAVLQLHYQPGRVSVTVQDDGVGLMDGTYQRPGIHALRALSYRLAEMDGSLEVSEGKSGGVMVRGSLPLGSS
jgi:signal transduction histidine kinase